MRTPNVSAVIDTEVVLCLRRELASCTGCLSRLSTPASVAVRRLELGFDGDMMFIGLSPLDPYLIDVTKLEQSRGLRRAGDHTQVVPDPKNAHIRNRRTHTDEVAAIAVLIAMVLGGNPSLCMAGALGHDIGHTPFGHVGETFLGQKTGRNFRHEVFGCVVAQHIERSGFGLNLTRQTLRVMHRHSRGAKELKTGGLSLEEAIVMYADKIAYLFADYNDLLRLLKADYRINLSRDEIVEIHNTMRSLGRSQRERVARCVTALCQESAEVGFVSFGRGEVFEKFEAARRAMYKFYPSNNPSKESFFPFLGNVYETLGRLLPNVDPTVLFALLCDDDVYAINSALIRPDREIRRLLLRELSVSDVVPHLRNRKIDPFDPDLDWDGIPDVSYTT